MPPARTLARFLVPLAFLGAQWVVDDARPFGYWTRFAWLVLLFAFAVYLATMVSGGLRSATVVIASIVLCLVVAEASAVLALTSRATTSRATQILTPPRQFALHPILGWGAEHPGVFHQTILDPRTGRVIYDIDYTIDQHLNRQTISAEDGPTVAFFGDSFTFGAGLPDAETLPQLFFDITGRKLRILNLGVNGYGAHQFLRALETGMYDELLRTPRFFVFQTAPWHADRSACIDDQMMLSPRYTMVDGQPKFRGACRDRWSLLIGKLFTMQMYSVFLQPVLQGSSPEKINLYIAILLRAGELTREKYGVPTVILYVPDEIYLRGSGYTDQQIMQRLRDGGLTVVDGGLNPAAFPGQDLSIPGDGHPTGVANRARAVILHDAVADLMR
jgi:hypothetical protein